MKKRELAVISNDIVLSKTDMTPFDFKVFLMFASKIRPKDKECRAKNKPIEICFDGDERFGIKDRQSFFKKVRKSAANIQKSTFAVTEKTRTRVYSPFSYVQHDNSEKNMTVRFNPDFLPFIYELNSTGYTKIVMMNALILSGKHSPRLYAAFTSKAWQSNGGIFTIEFLKNYLNCNKDSYLQASGFIKKIIDPCIAEINLKTDVFIEYFIKKTGKKITSIKVIVIDDPTKTESPIDLEKKGIEFVKSIGGKVVSNDDILKEFSKIKTI